MRSIAYRLPEIQIFSRIIRSKLFRLSSLDPDVLLPQVIGDSLPYWARNLVGNTNL